MNLFFLYLLSFYFVCNLISAQVEHYYVSGESVHRLIARSFIVNDDSVAIFFAIPSKDIETTVMKEFKFEGKIFNIYLLSSDHYDDTSISFTIDSNNVVFADSLYIYGKKMFKMKHTNQNSLACIELKNKINKNIYFIFDEIRSLNTEVFHLNKLPYYTSLRYLYSDSVQKFHQYASISKFWQFDSLENQPAFILHTKDKINYNEVSVTDTSKLKFNTISYHNNRRSDAAFSFYIPNQSIYPADTALPSLIKPLVYLTSKSQVKRMLKHKDAKQKLEKYWDEIEQNSGKLLRKVYYDRVKYANEHFTSTKAGWKTDRGAVYILFGRPDAIAIRTNFEIWLYESAPEYQTPLYFYFRRIIHPICTNCYQIERQRIYQPFWIEAARNWEKGKIKIK